MRLKIERVKDILIIYIDRLIGIKETITIAFPRTEYQKYVIYQVRDTSRYVPDKDKKAFAGYLKAIFR